MTLALHFFVKKISKYKFLISLILPISNNALSKCHENICIDDKIIDNKIELHAQNQDKTPAILEISYDLQNLKLTPDSLTQIELLPYQKRIISTLEKVDVSKNYSFSYRFTVNRLTSSLQCSGDVCIDSRNTKTGIELISINRTYGDVTLQLDAQLQNLKSDPLMPLVKILPPKSQSTIAILNRLQPAQSHRLQLKMRHIHGNLYAVQDPSNKYRLPYSSGSAYLVGQSYDGSFTHKGSNRYAVDFNMPVGTSILAARSGTVVEIKNNGKLGYPETRCESEGNFVRVRHGDTTIAEYAHFKYQGIVVSLGQNVREGQLLGYSGDTGYASGPHLHFAVKKPSSIDTWESLPITFTTSQGFINRPVEGKSYLAP